MRWQPQGTEFKRVLVWEVYQYRTYRNASAWSWSVKSRNGRVLVESREIFPTRYLAARGARTFGAPLTLMKHLRVTALHDGETLVLNWSKE